jgi:hypothetical protein
MQSKGCNGKTAYDISQLVEPKQLSTKIFVIKFGAYTLNQHKKKRGLNLTLRKLLS